MSKVLEAIAVVAEVTGTTLSRGAVMALESELRPYGEDAALKALRRCMREVKHRLTLADIIERLDGGDGRPTADEAWAIALEAMDEAATVVLSEEMASALGAARPIYLDGDRVGARMAFRAAYERAVGSARDAGVPVRWFPSLGHDARGREMALRRAVEAQRLTATQVRGLLPPPRENAPEATTLRLDGPVASTDVMRETLARLKVAIAGGAR